METILIDEREITNKFVEKAQDIILKACEEYTEIIADVYSAQKKLFENTTFKIIVENNEVEVLNDEYQNNKVV